MKVCEIFASIQGESTHAGRPCVFIRLTGCNLRCCYCDTTYAYEEGSEMSLDEIVVSVDGRGIGLVELTGGEPLLQSGAADLARTLLDKGHEVLIETNGSQDIGGVDSRAVIILDMKTPGSGMMGQNLLSNLVRLKQTDELKFVITSPEDYRWAKGFMEDHRLSGRCQILFSPAFGQVDPAELGRWIITDRLPVRLNLQIHKYLYDPAQRGV